jgi:hypothetical protein
MIFCHDLFGQSKIVSNGNQQWFQYYNQAKLGNKWTLFSDLGYRWKDGFHENSQYIIRTAIGYSIHPSLRISLGVAHLGSYIAKKASIFEFRPYQELALKNNFNEIELTNRFRVEERFFNFDYNGEIQLPSDFNFRFRYSIMMGIPLFRLSKEKTNRIFLLYIGDEIFINAGNTIANNIFDQNRIIFSPSLKLNEQVTFSLTWNSQFASTSLQNTYKYTNVIWFQIKHKLGI